MALVEYFLVSAIAIAWAIFQLSLPSFLIIASTKERAIHLAFAMTLLFLVCPLLKRTGKPTRAMSHSGRIPPADWIFTVLGAATALYLAINFDAIAMRAGAPTTLDLLSGSILVLLLLEAARRSVGPALSVIAVLFTCYAFSGPYMPDILAFKGVSLNNIISNIALSTEGIYGIPLGVSTSIVYLFVLLGALLDKAGAGRFFTNWPCPFWADIRGGRQKRQSWQAARPVLFPAPASPISSPRALSRSR